MYLKITQDGIECPYDLRRNHPDVSFPRNPSDANLPAGVHKVTVDQDPAHDPCTQRVIRGTPVQEGDNWVIPKIVENRPPEEIETRLTRALDRYIDSVAQAKGYDNRITASLRAAAPNSRWHTAGLAFLEWMDNCYALAEDMLDDVKAGKRSIPTWVELKAELPEMIWP